jgi:hypothetical protein
LDQGSVYTFNRTEDLLVMIQHDRKVSIIEGLTFLSFLTPELITEEVILAAFDALGTSRPGRGTA